MGTLRLVLRDGERTEALATIEWPSHLDADARAFVIENLLAERCGSARAAQKLLDAGVLTAAERARFLAEKKIFLPEPPHALASEMDLEDFVAEFSVALQKLRAAPKEAELLITLSASAAPQ
ncbi:MAG: hypothetical protein QM817_02990 [Archangium sp.]